MKVIMEVTFFKTQIEFRNWLEKNHKIETELFVGFYKVGTNKPSMTWSQSVDQALCFGWIDGVRKSIDENSYYIRFTPRKKASIWSAINIKKVESLINQGLMKEDGLIAFSYKTKDKSNVYSYENAPLKLNENFESLFKKNIKAWNYYTNQAPSYKKAVIHWIMVAKQEKTKLSRLEKLIKSSENEKKLM